MAESVYGGAFSRSVPTFDPPLPSDPDFIVGKNEMLQKEILIWLFLVHKLLDFPPPPLKAELWLAPHRHGACVRVCAFPPSPVLRSLCVGCGAPQRSAARPSNSHFIPREYVPLFRNVPRTQPSTAPPAWAAVRPNTAPRAPARPHRR